MDIVEILVTLLLVCVVLGAAYWGAGFIPAPFGRFARFAIIVVAVIILLLWISRNFSLVI